MAEVKGTIISSMISPGDTLAAFPTHEDVYGKGGFVVVPTFGDLSFIPTQRQKVGMVIYVADSNTFYQINSISFPLTGVTAHFTLSSLQVTTNVTANNLAANQVVYDQTGNSIQWNKAFETSTVYQNVSSTFATNTLLQQTSSLLLTRNIFAQTSGTFLPVTTFMETSGTFLPATTYQSTSGLFATNTTLQNVSSQLLPTTIYQGASGDWRDVATNVRANSAFWSTGGNPTLVFNEQTKGLNILGGNTVTLSSLATTTAITNYLSTNNVLISSLTVFDNISAKGVLYGQATDNQLNLTSTNTIQNSSIASALNLLSPPPTYNQPTVSMTQFAVPNVEVGENVYPSLFLNWTQNDAGPISQWVLRKNGITITQGNNLPFQYTPTSFDVAETQTTTYQLSVNYLTGATKNNVLGFPDNRNRITANSRTTQTSYRGYFRYFYGSVTNEKRNDILLNPTVNTRLLSSALGLSNNSIPPFYIDKTSIIIAVPITKKLKSAVTQALEEIKGNFAENLVTVEDAAVPAYAWDYRLYATTSIKPLQNILTITLEDV